MLLALQIEEFSAALQQSLQLQSVQASNLLKYQATSSCPRHIYAFLVRPQSVKVMV